MILAACGERGPQQREGAGDREDLDDDAESVGPPFRQHAQRRRQVDAVWRVQPEVAALERARVDRAQVPGHELMSGLEELVPVAPYDGIRVRGHGQAPEPAELHEAGDRERREAEQRPDRPPPLGGEPGAGHVCRKADGAR